MRVFVVLGGLASVVVIGCGQSGAGAPAVAVRVEGPGRILSFPPAIDCPGICFASFPAGTPVRLLATSADDVTFVEWSGECSGAVGCSFVLARDAAVLARFEPLEPAQKK